MTALPTLTDGDLVLRPWRLDDARALVAALRDPGISWWIDAIAFPYTDEHAAAFLAENDAFAICAGGAPVGSCAVHPLRPLHGVAAVGYWLAPDARGRGLATRAVRLAARWVFGELGYERLELHADERNEASCRVAERAGFRLDGTMRSARWNARQERRIDTRIYSLLPGELASAEAPK